MPGLTKQVPRFFMTAQNNTDGPWKYLQKLFGGQGVKGSGIVGTATVASGQTSVTITDAAVQATDLFFVTILAKGANAASYIGVTSIVANTSYVLNVSADPGAGGVTLAVIRLPAQLLFGS